MMRLNRNYYIALLTSIIIIEHHHRTSRKNMHDCLHAAQKYAALKLKMKTKIQNSWLELVCRQDLLLLDYLRLSKNFGLNLKWIFCSTVISRYHNRFEDLGLDVPLIQSNLNQAFINTNFFQTFCHLQLPPLMYTHTQRCLSPQNAIANTTTNTDTECCREERVCASSAYYYYFLGNV